MTVNRRQGKGFASGLLVGAAAMAGAWLSLRSASSPELNKPEPAIPPQPPQPPLPDKPRARVPPTRLEPDKPQAAVPPPRPAPDRPKTTAPHSQPATEERETPILPPQPEAPTSRQLAIFVSVFVLAAAIAGAWLTLGSPFSPARDKAKTSVEAPQPVAPALPQLAACPSQPAAAVAGEKDGQFPFQNDLSGLIAADGATFIVIGKEASAAGRTRDAEVAFLMSCRVADKLKGTGSLESVDAKYQLASHYSKMALDAGSAAASNRMELLRRAELLYLDSLSTYVAKYGEAHEKSRFAVEGLAAVRQTLAQADNLQPAPVVPMPEKSAQELALAPTPPVSAAAPGTSRPSQATVPRPQNRNAEFAQTAPSESQRLNAPRQYKASFDCSRARSVSEKIICSDAELSRMDRDLGVVYARARNLTSDRTAFRRQQQEEWRRREEICRDRECLLRWYTQRRFQLLDDINKAGAWTQPTLSRWSRGQDDALYRGR